MAEHAAFDPILLNAGLSVHNADWNWQNVSSPFARLYMVKDGSAKIHVTGREHDICPGYLYFIPPFTLHGYSCDGMLQSYYFHIYEKPSARVRVLEEYSMPFKVPAGDLEQALVCRLLEINPGRELPRYDPSYYDNAENLISYIRKNERNPIDISVETTGILDILLSRFMSGAVVKAPVSDDRIRKVLSYIRKNTGRNISTGLLAAQCYLSEDHFIRLFKKELGCTPVAYINMRKMETAQLLLATTRLPVKDIAHRVSFQNLSYFNRLFRRTTGMTPIQYRKGQ